MKEKTNKVVRVNAKEILSNFDPDSPDFGINGRQKFMVKVGGKFARKGVSVRYEISDTPYYFFSEVQARDCYHFFKNRGAKLESEAA